MGSDMMYMTDSERASLTLSSQMGNVRRNLKIKDKDRPTGMIGHAWTASFDRGKDNLELESRIFYSFTLDNLQKFLEIKNNRYLDFRVAKNSQMVKSITFDIDGFLFKTTKKGVFFKTKKNLFVGVLKNIEAITDYNWTKISFAKLDKLVNMISSS